MARVSAALPRGAVDFVGVAAVSAMSVSEFGDPIANTVVADEIDQLLPPLPAFLSLRLTAFAYRARRKRT